MNTCDARLLFACGRRAIRSALELEHSAQGRGSVASIYGSETTASFARVLDGIARSVASLEIVHRDFGVARGARELRAWLAELRKQRVALADYRTAPQPEIDLDAVFDDTSLDSQTRAGAAIALRGRDGDEAAARLRLAASTTASPELRMAFEKIAEGSFDDDLEERLRVALEKIADGAPDSEIARSIEKLR